MIGAHRAPSHLFTRFSLPPEPLRPPIPPPGPPPDFYSLTPGDSHGTLRSPRTGNTGLTGIAPSRRNPSPITTVPVGIDMRPPSWTAAVPIGMSLRTSSHLAPAVPFGIQLRQQPPLDPPPSSPAVPVGIQLKHLMTPIVLPILDSQQSIPPNTHETSAHCFEPERTAAETRNHHRWQTRNTLDKNLVGTLPPVLSIFDAPRATPDDDNFVPPPWLLASIIRVTSSPGTVPNPPPFLFRTDAPALQHNADLLKEHDYDLSQLLPNFQDTTIAYGSEFRPIEDLRSTFRQHPNFEFFESTVLDGMHYHFTKELTDDERMAELEAQITRGNHKSATSDPEGTSKMTGKDVTKGFSLPLPASIVPKI